MRKNPCLDSLEFLFSTSILCLSPKDFRKSVSCKNSMVKAIIKVTMATVIELVFKKLLKKQYNNITTRKSPIVRRMKPSFKKAAIKTSITNSKIKAIK